jgi:ketosteroid isomerase-like protein
MSQENVEKVEAAYDAWNKGDFDTAFEFADPGLEWVMSGAFPGLKPIYRGKEEIREWWDRLREPFDRFLIWPERIVERGDQVIAIVGFHGRGEGSGAPVDMTMGHVFTFRDGLAVRFQAYASPAEALEAAGLSE